MPLTAAAGASHWQPTQVKCDAITQTVGLYYPSQSELNQRNQELINKMSDKDTKDRKPPLTPISPGRGSLSLLLYETTPTTISIASAHWRG